MSNKTFALMSYLKNKVVYLDLLYSKDLFALVSDKCQLKMMVPEKIIEITKSSNRTCQQNLSMNA